MNQIQIGYSPLKKAMDAFEIDTSNIQIKDVVEIIINKINLKNKKGNTLG